MKIVRYAVLGTLLLSAAACAPQSAYDARDDLQLTAGAARAAAGGAGARARTMGEVAKEIQMDVDNIKEVERWFDEQRIISFD